MDNRPCIVISDPDIITEVYRDSERFLSGQDAHPSMFTVLFGASAMILHDGVRHNKERSKLQVAFLPMVMPAYYDIIRESSIAFWERVSAVTRVQGNCRLADMVREHFLRVMIQVTGGREAVDRGAELTEMFRRVLKGIVSIPGTPAHRNAQKARIQLMQVLRELIKGKCVESRGIVKRIEEAGRVSKDMVKRGSVDIITLLCSEVDATDSEVEEIAQTIFFTWMAGYATQSSTVLCALGKLDVVKERLEEEQRAVKRRLGMNVSLHDVRRGSMPVLEAYLDEIMRLYPAVTIVFRKAEKETTLGGHDIAANTVLVLDWWDAGRSESHFKRARELDVDRHLRKGAESRKIGMTAFGVPGGRHYCLGSALARISMMCLMSELLSNWDMHLAPKQDLTVKRYTEVMPRSGCVVSKCTKKPMSLLQRRMRSMQH